MVPIALLYVKNWEEECCKQKKEEFREQFRESIQTLSAILKVGYSVENAIRETWKEICPIYKKKTRIIKEYETMVHQLDLNMTAEEFCNGIWRCKTSGRRQYCHYSACGRRNRRKNGS